MPERRRHHADMTGQRVYVSHPTDRGEVIEDADGRLVRVRWDDDNEVTWSRRDLLRAVGEVRPRV